MRRLATRRNPLFLAAVAAVLAIVSVAAFVAGNIGIGYVGAILAGLAVISPFVSQAAADAPRLGAEFVHSMRSDAVALMLTNTGTGPGNVREIRMDVASEQDHTFTVTYNVEEVALYPRQRVFLPIREGDADGWMLSTYFDKITLTLRASVYSGQGRMLAKIESGQSE